MATACARDAPKRTSSVEANIGQAPNAARVAIVAYLSIAITRSADHHPLSPLTMVPHPSYVRQYRSTNNSSTEIQRHPLRVKKNGSSAAVDFGPARIDVATRTTFVSFKMNTTRNVGRKYQRARPTMANAVVVCGRKTPAALSTAAAIRVITASRKTNIIRSAARGTSATVYRARERTNSAVVASDRTVLGVVRTLATTVSCKTRITRSVVRRCSRNSIFFVNPIEKKTAVFFIKKKRSYRIFYTHLSRSSVAITTTTTHR